MNCICVFLINLESFYNYLLKLFFFTSLTISSHDNSRGKQKDWCLPPDLQMFHLLKKVDHLPDLKGKNYIIIFLDCQIVFI